MIALINPNNVVLSRDPLTTGVVYMPFGLAYLAAALEAAEFPVEVIDAFGTDPLRVRREKEFLVLGLTPDEVVARVPGEAHMAFVFAINLANHMSTHAIVAALRAARPDLVIVVMENTQAVTAYSLRDVAAEFYEAGASYILTGEAEERGVALARHVLAGGEFPANGIGTPQSYTPPASFIHALDDLAFPAWEKFPLENYWGLKFGHGPVSAPRYLPLLTSRGCPYSCRFCVVPATNETKWRGRSSANIADEMAYMMKRFGVREFHIEDLNPTVSEKRTQELCNEIIGRRLDVSWKCVSGTKVETIKSVETIDLMRRAGCSYISISPETGSPEVLKRINKPFNLEHAVKLVARMNQVGIYAQACFVLGFPGETPKDLEMTRDLALDMTRKGVDEIALFIIAPVPGSDIYGSMKGYTSLSECNFSPTWRDDYQMLSTFRSNLYRSFLLTKLRHHPMKVAKQCLRFLRRNFATKMEMVPYRALRYRLAALFAPRS